MYLGIDLGTQSVKVLLVDADGKIVRREQEPYPIHRPQPGHAEQNPAEWWAATVKAVQAVARHYADAITGISADGQMHGLVLLDEKGEVVRPAIIWMDQRSAPQVEQFAGDIWGRATMNPLATGMAAASLLWLKENEPESLVKTTTILGPKDWIRYKLSGALHAEPGDASGLLLLDATTRQWSPEILNLLDFSAELLPPLVSSTDVVGMLTEQAAADFGLRGAVQIVAGSGDQAAMLTGSGVVEPGQAALTLGTGGQFSVVAAKPAGSVLLNTFCHALPDMWYVMGALLAGGYALSWWQQVLNRPLDRILGEAADAPPGCEGLIFHPHLNGQREPGLAETTASFSNITGRHDARHLNRAVLEGVAFALNDRLNNLRRADANPERIIFGGGAAKGDLWGKIIASVFDLPLTRLHGDEQTAFGSAMMAAVGTGHFVDVNEAARAWVTPADTIEPVAAWVPIYEEMYANFAGTVTKGTS